MLAGPWWTREIKNMFMLRRWPKCSFQCLLWDSNAIYVHWLPAIVIKMLMKSGQAIEQAAAAANLQFWKPCSKVAQIIFQHHRWNKKFLYTYFWKIVKMSKEISEEFGEWLSLSTFTAFLPKIRAVSRVELGPEIVPL